MEDILEQALEIVQARWDGAGPAAVEEETSRLGEPRHYTYQVSAANIPGYKVALFHRPLATPIIVVNKNLSWDEQERLAAVVWSIFIGQGPEVREGPFELKFREGAL